MQTQNLTQKLRHELIEYAFNVVYLMLVFAAFTQYRRFLLAEYSITYTRYWVGLFGALVLGKVIMIGSVFRLGRWLEDKPLIVPTTYNLEHGSPWVFGVLVNNIWSLTSDKQGGSYSTGLIQPFLNYNFPGGLYLTSAPILAVDWKAESGRQWTVLLGGGVGKIFYFGKLLVNTQISAYYNVVKHDFAAS
jgi:hypothetical protein